MKQVRLTVLPVVFALVAAACGGGDGDGGGGGGEPGGAGQDTGEVSVFGAPTGDEGAAIQQVIEDNVNSEAEYTATYEGSDSFEEQVKIRIEGGNPPDIALYPQPGAIIEQAQAGKAIALEDLGFDIAALEETYGPYLIGLGEYEGKHYGLPTNVNLKSMVWYPLPEFTDNGYAVPTTWEEMVSLSGQIAGTGTTPWCIGFGSEAATGWPGTDWIEDIMLRTAGAEVYDQWVNHEIPFNDPQVKRAFELYGEILFGEGYVLGGANQISAIDFRDAPDPMFNDPPSCFLHRQASFITTFFPEGNEAGTDYDVFAFPDIDEGKKGALVAGELAAVFNNRPEVVDFLNRFTSVEVQCAQGSILGGGRISPNIGVGPECYKNPILATAAEAIVEALKVNGARFDASDLMPSAVGQGTWWTGMVEYARSGPESLDDILAQIEASWPA